MRTMLKPLCVSGLLSVLAFHGSAQDKIIRSGIAGTWYPDNADELREQFAEFFKSARKPEVKGNIISLILPHAGYAYSGQTAASGISQLTRKYRTVIVIGPTHNVRMPNAYSVPLFDSYETPLGKVPCDKQLAAKLLENPIFRDLPAALEPEHSVQIEIPILQYALKDFKLVFIVAGQCDYATIEKAGKAIGAVADSETLIVASSDFIHCGPRFGYMPFKTNTPENVKKIDMQAFEFIKAKDPKGFFSFVEESGATICGATPIATMMCALPGDAQPHFVEHTDSGIVTGEKDRSTTVSYVAAAFTGEWKKKADAGAKEETKPGALSKADKESLLSLARKTIEHYLKNGREPRMEDIGIKITDGLKEERAAFVTLKRKGHLRGCIGEIFPSQPLYRSVMSNAVNAAVNDYRFSKVTEKELPEISIEISALTVPKKVDSYKDIRIGLDGMVLKKGFNKAVFLPQVAPEQGWNLDQTLTNLAMKAGLAPDAWKEGAEFMTFQAEVFGEE